MPKSSPVTPVTQRPAEVLTHGQLTLRRWREADAGTIYRIASASLEHLRPWLPWAADYGPDDAASFAARCEQDWELGAAVNYAVMVGGLPVGGCGLMSRIGSGGLEVRYRVGADHTHRARAAGYRPGRDQA